MEFKDKLKELRKEKGVSQEELAQAVYKSRSTVAKWETGLRLPDEESAELLAEYFGVEVCELLVNGEAEQTIVTKNKSISLQRKIIIALGSVLGAFALVCIVILVIGLISINRKPQQGEPGMAYYGIVEYSEEFGYNVNIPYVGLCSIPSLGEDCLPSAEPYSPADGDLIYIYFNYENCPVYIMESYPARFSASAWNIRVLKQNVSLKANEQGYLLTCEQEELIYEFGVGDTVCLFYYEGVTSDAPEGWGNSAVARILCCKAEIVEISDGLVTMQLPPIEDLRNFLIKFSGGFDYQLDSDWQ